MVCVDEFDVYGWVFLELIEEVFFNELCFFFGGDFYIVWSEEEDLFFYFLYVVVEGICEVVVEVDEVFGEFGV